MINEKESRVTYIGVCTTVNDLMVKKMDTPLFHILREVMLEFVPKPFIMLLC